MMSEDKRKIQYVVNVPVPISVPTPDEVAAATPSFEPFLAKLVESKHMSEEEVTAFLSFASYLSGSAPFLLDTFLESYRTLKAELTKNNSKLLLP